MAAGWLVERNFVGHTEGWWLDSFYANESAAREHVRQIRAHARRNGYALRARKDV